MVQTARKVIGSKACIALIPPFCFAVIWLPLLAVLVSERCHDHVDFIDQRSRVLVLGIPFLGD